MSAPAADRLAGAVRDAGAGRYDRARHVLDTLGGAGGDDPAVLDLLARIHAQRGEFAEADACWSRVREVSPHDDATTAAARSGRRRIAALQARRQPPSTGRRLATATLALTAAGAVVAGIALPRPADSGRPGTAIGEQLTALRAQQAGLARQLGALRTALDGAAPGRLRTAAQLAAALSGTGTTVSVRGNYLGVTFAEGLFGPGATPTAAGERALDALARRLRSAAVTGPVVVTGHTDDAPLPPGSSYTDRVTLGFARAQTAAVRLSSGAGIPLTAFGIRSTGTAGPPFPDDSAADRARNDTVTVLIGPA